MATSTSYTYTDLLEISLRKLGVLSEGGSANTNQKNDGLEIANCIIKRFDADIFNKWFTKSASTTEAYTAGTASNDLATDVLWIEQAVWETTATTTTVQVKELTVREYGDITNKTTQSTPQWYFLSTDLSTPKLYLYPVPTANGSIYYWYRRKADLFDNVTDTADIPDEWLYWFVLQFTADLADDYGKDPALRQYWQGRADAEFQRIMSKETINPTKSGGNQ